MANKSERIAVLMSTYNGEHYIHQQIDSILSQEGVELDLYFRDDGSSDSTIDIIKKYAMQDNVFIVPNGANLGPGCSFLTLLYYVANLGKYRYYAFADQDDIWLPQKLKVAIKQLQKYNSFPALYGSNRIVFEEGKEENLLLKNDIDNSLQRLISKNEVSGCTMVLNDALVRQIVAHDMPSVEVLDYRLHDSWAILVALITGKVVYDTDSYILYRVHKDNTVGIKKTPFKVRMKHLCRKGNGRTDRNNIRKKTAEILLEYYPTMSSDNRKILEVYANYQNSWKDRWNFIKSTDLIRATGENLFIFRLKILLNFV